MYFTIRLDCDVIYIYFLFEKQAFKGLLSRLLLYKDHIYIKYGAVLMLETKIH